MKDLWTEKYRPYKVNEYVFRDADQKKQVEVWVKEKSIPHLLFSGAPGIGKTTLAKLLINEIEVDEYDVLEINASRENSVDTIREKIIGFVQTMPFGDFKVVVLDEADYMSPNGQAALRNVMEMYASTARFILTCNYPNRIIPAIHSRCQGFHISKIDKMDFMGRVATVLKNEGAECDMETLESYTDATYPDLRKCLNLIQMNTIDGKLKPPSESENSSADYKLQMVDMFKQGKYREARKLLCSQVRQEEMEDLFRWMYDNLNLWSDTEDGQDEAILVIRQGAVNNSLVSDPEINLSATFVELSKIQ